MPSPPIGYFCPLCKSHGLTLRRTRREDQCHKHWKCMMCGYQEEYQREYQREEEEVTSENRDSKKERVDYILRSIAEKDTEIRERTKQTKTLIWCTLCGIIFGMVFLSSMMSAFAGCL